MRLYEYEAKQIFEKHGIRIPKQIAVISNDDEINTLILDSPTMIKAMVLIGGRGKAGGIKKTSNINEAKEAIDKIFGLTIHGYPINKILLEEAVDVANEIYFSVTTDPATFDVIVIASASGGVDIEEIARTKPEEIWKKVILDNAFVLEDEIAEEIVEFLTNKNQELSAAKVELKATIISLYSVFQQKRHLVINWMVLVIPTAPDIF